MQVSPLSLRQWSNTALQYNPQDRFPSARAMKEALIMVARKTGALNSASLRSAPIFN